MPANVAYARSRPTGAIILFAYRQPTKKPNASAVAINPMTPGENPIAENRSGSSDPMTPAPIMISAVLMRGGATRQGMAVLTAGPEAAWPTLMTRPPRCIERAARYAPHGDRRVHKNTPPTAIPAPPPPCPAAAIRRGTVGPRVGFAFPRRHTRAAIRALPLASSAAVSTTDERPRRTATTAPAGATAATRKPARGAARWRCRIFRA